MPYNVSARARQSLALDQTAEAWPRWYAAIRCTCPRLVTVTTADVARCWPGLSWARWLGRLRCAGCGGRPVRVELVDSLRTDREPQRIVLRGAPEAAGLALPRTEVQRVEILEPPSEAASLRATPLRDLRGLWLHTRCGCKSSTIAADQLARRLSSGTLGGVLARLRCRDRCGEAPRWAALSVDQVLGAPGMMGAEPGWSVVMVGDQATGS